MFNAKTQQIYEKYLLLLSDFAEQYADELPERTKVKFQKSLVKYYDNELAESVKHEKFMLRAKDTLFKRALKTQKKIARLPSITEQNVNKALQSLGLEQNVTDEILRLMLLGLSEPEEPLNEPVEEQVDDVVEEEVVDSDEITEPAPSLEPTEDLVEPVEEPSAEAEQPPEEPKTSYWTTRRKNRTKTEESDT